MTVCAWLFIDSRDQFQFGRTTRHNLLSNVTTDSAMNFDTAIIQTKIVAKKIKNNHWDGRCSNDSQVPKGASLLILELEGKGDILTACVEYESLCYEMKTLFTFCLSFGCQLIKYWFLGPTSNNKSIQSIMGIHKLPHQTSMYNIRQKSFFSY